MLFGIHVYFTHAPASDIYTWGEKIAKKSIEVKPPYSMAHNENFIILPKTIHMSVS
jgi:hypothetical protein